MPNLLEQRNREIWEGHSRILEDVTHTLGGIGLGLVLYPATRRSYKAIGYTLLLASTALHFYADMTGPKSARLVDRTKSAVGMVA